MNRDVHNLRLALSLNTIMSLTMAVIFIFTMLYGNNGGLESLPEHSRITDINKFYEGWIETLLFTVIGLFGLYILLTTKEL